MLKSPCSDDHTDSGDDEDIDGSIDYSDCVAVDDVDYDDDSDDNDDNSGNDGDNDDNNDHTYQRTLQCHKQQFLFYFYQGFLPCPNRLISASRILVDRHQHKGCFLAKR